MKLIQKIEIVALSYQLINSKNIIERMRGISIISVGFSFVILQWILRENICWQCLQYLLDVILSYEMAEFSVVQGFILLTFGILTPTLDQYTDIILVMRLLNGPTSSTILKSGKQMSFILFFDISFLRKPLSHYCCDH